MSDTRIRVFAYGSNMDSRQMLSRCPESAYVSTGLLKNYRLDFGGWSGKWRGGVATVVQDVGRIVPGVIYRVSPDDLGMLDMYEGFPFVYVRRLVSIKTKLGSKLPCLVYELRNHNANRPGVAPGMDYLKLIASAYRFWGLRRYADVLYTAVRRCRPGQPIYNGYPPLPTGEASVTEWVSSPTLPSQQLPLRPPLRRVK